MHLTLTLPTYKWGKVKKLFSKSIKKREQERIKHLQQINLQEHQWLKVQIGIKLGELLICHPNRLETSKSCATQS